MRHHMERIDQGLRVGEGDSDKSGAAFCIGNGGFQVIRDCRECDIIGLRHSLVFTLECDYLPRLRIGKGECYIL